ncbi:hypothetical protein KUTeg_002475 [Tegillarca granosa]|uniref:Uncharacterized protein n=1 Tax=Tegillarca granosa TaxID=220873 RepID=A0ABQ9FUG2_TEGGR|nr:hypothetical protein KUTeg_001597 [Tegillarca granosa]KAJ8320888.1 hypothetical protein KUTeg_002475 [Tegillarca granosa]
MAQGDPGKWNLPGWRIEQKYSPGVLIGNWSEERYNFQRGTTKHNSTHRIDFRNYGAQKPDVIVRRKALMQNNGVGPEYLFHHHGSRYSNNMISWYDEHYNGRWKENPVPYKPRQWNSHTLSWALEKSDHPLQGSATNFGLLDSKKKRWDDQVADETKGDFVTTYRNSYIRSATQPVSFRYAIPRDRSTSLHPYNKINKDLHLRNSPTIKAPESAPPMVAASVS